MCVCVCLLFIGSLKHLLAHTEINLHLLYLAVILTPPKKKHYLFLINIKRSQKETQQTMESTSINRNLIQIIPIIGMMWKQCEKWHYKLVEYFIWHLRISRCPIPLPDSMCVCVCVPINLN